VLSEHQSDLEYKTVATFSMELVFVVAIVVVIVVVAVQVVAEWQVTATKTWQLDHYCNNCLLIVMRQQEAKAILVTD
jgi:cell division protein FtsL